MATFEVNLTAFYGTNNFCLFIFRSHIESVVLNTKTYLSVRVLQDNGTYIHNCLLIIDYFLQKFSSSLCYVTMEHSIDNLSASDHVIIMVSGIYKRNFFFVRREVICSRKSKWKK